MKTNFYLNHKTFIKGFEALNIEGKKFKKFSLDRRLTQTEKKILESLLYLKKNRVKKGLELLLSLQPKNPFIDGIKFLCIGHFYNNSGQMKKANHQFKESIKLLSSIEDTRYQFQALVSYQLNSFNLKNYEEVLVSFNTIKHFSLNTKAMEASFYQCRAIFEIASSNFSCAVETIDYIFSNYGELVKERKSYFYVIKLMAQFQEGKLDDFATDLDIYKTLSGFKIKENYKYMLSLFKFIYSNETLYVYERDFSSIPYLFHELNVIKSLSVQEIESAKRSWEYLRGVNPNVFSENFRYNGDYCLFSKAFEKVEANFLVEAISIKGIGEIKSIHDKILYILEQNERAVSKEYLIKLLWNEEMDEKNIIRLSTQISRLRKKISTKIMIKNGMYSLKKSA